MSKLGKTISNGVSELKKKAPATRAKKPAAKATKKAEAKKKAAAAPKRTGKQWFAKNEKSGKVFGPSPLIVGAAKLAGFKGETAAYVKNQRYRVMISEEPWIIVTPEAAQRDHIELKF